MSSFEISVRSNVKEISKKLSALAEKQLAFAASRAINDTVQDCRKTVPAEMKKVFRNPVARTLNSLRYKNSDKKSMEAKVWIEDFGGKGIAPAKYLGPEILGGNRSQKRFERALQKRGLMQSGMFAMPAAAAPRDADGNVPGSFYVTILSYLGAFGEQGYRANMTDKPRKKIAGVVRTERGFKSISGAVYFVAKGSGKTAHLHPGIYKKSGTHGAKVEPIFYFVNSATYEARFNFKGVVEKTVKQNFDGHLKTRLAEAIASARP